MEKIKVTCEIELSFESYNTLTKNKRARKAIENWIRSALENWTDPIPLYIEKVGQSHIEDTTILIKLKVKSK